jgi:hypothetical protein
MRLVALCMDCKEVEVIKYDPSSNYFNMMTVVPVSMSYVPTQNIGGFLKPQVTWCKCGSDNPRIVCRLDNSELIGFCEKCLSCPHRFMCATAREGDNGSV